MSIVHAINYQLAVATMLHNIHFAAKHIVISSLSIKAHSFRIGAATHAASIGYSDIQIQKMGRWKSSEAATNCAV